LFFLVLALCQCKHYLLFCLAFARYGFRPFPAVIPQAELETMLAAMQAEDASFVKAWLLLDEQAVPAVYQLRPSFEAAEPEYRAAMKILQRHGQASFPDKFSQE